MGIKSRGSYTTGGWCPKLSKCAKANKKCDKCVRFSEYKESKK
jgi:hypothetical protein